MKARLPGMLELAAPHASDRAQTTSAGALAWGPDTGFRSELLWAVAIGAAYLASAELGFKLAFATQQVTAVWPPTGIALAAFLLRGRRAWAGVFLGALLCNALRHETLATAGAIAVGNTLGPLAGAALMRRIGKVDISLRRLRDVLALAFLGAALGMIITATNGVTHLTLAGIVPWKAAPQVWFLWWVGDTMGALLVAPVILTIASPAAPIRALARRGELAVLAMALVLVGIAAFSTSLPLAYPVFPIVIWAALRFGQRETSVAIMLTAGIAVWQTAHDQGPFISGDPDSRLILLVTFLAVLSVMGLALGALSAERSAAEASLRQANDELETRVRVRTAELVQTNAELERRTAELARKNEEVEAFVYIVSHDLRAPLVNLQGFSRELEHSCHDLAQAIDQVELPAGVAQKIEMAMDDGIGLSLRYISASVSKFERLINALLALSRTGQQEYRLEALDMKAMVASTLDSFQQTVLASGAEVSLGILPQAHGDATAIGQVISNLIDNALKYLDPSRPGRIEIAGRREGAKVHYWVRDNGVGVPAGARLRLFNIFQRFHPEMAPGDGVGLASIKRIVERHEGNIWLDSETGGGSTFHFTLACADPLEGTS